MSRGDRLAVVGGVTLALVVPFAVLPSGAAVFVVLVAVWTLMLVVLRRAQVEQTRRERDAILDVVCPPPADLTGTAPWLPRSGRPLPQQQRRGDAS